MKKLWLLLCLPVLLFMGCGAKQSAEEKAMTALTNMSGYEATAKLTRKSSRGDNTYGTKQNYRAMDGAYRLELTSPETVAGNYTIFDGARVCQYNPQVDSKVILDVPESQPRNELFLGQFLHNYTTDPDATLAEEEVDGNNCLVFGAKIAGDNKYLSSEKMWVDAKSGIPVRLVIYDADGGERYIVGYEEFTYNPEVDEAIFTIPQ